MTRRQGRFETDSLTRAARQEAQSSCCRARGRRHTPQTLPSTSRNITRQRVFAREVFDRSRLAIEGQLDVSGCRSDEAGNDSEQRGLPRSVWSNEPEYFTSIDRQRDVV